LHTLIAVLLGHVPPPPEKAALDRAILEVYRQAGITPDPRTHHRPAPLLRDLAHVLDQDEDVAARDLAARMAPWVHGSFKDLFDAATTHRPDGHLVVWSLRHLPDELRTVATLLALDHVWRQVDLPPQYRRASAGSRPEGRRLVVVDEAWQL